MDRLGGVTRVDEHLRAFLGAVLGAREHDHALVPLLLEDGAQQLGLATVEDGHDVLRDGLGGLAVFGDLHDGGVAQKRSQVVLDRLVDGGGEQQRLALGRDLLDDRGDVGQKSHVEHAVGLVEHEHLDGGQVDDAALNQVHQAPRRGDEDVGAIAQLADLGAVGRAAEHGGDVVVGAVRNLHARARALLRQLARGADDQHARRPSAALAPARAGLELRQGGQQERGGLAGAGGGCGDQVAPGQDMGDGLLLNGRGVLVSQPVDGVKGGVGQAELGE